MKTIASWLRSRNDAAIRKEVRQIRMKANLVETIVLGHAAGDALGVPVEYWPKEKLQAHPVKDMLGFGAVIVPQGSWSDATSLGLAAMDSMADTGFADETAIMQRFLAYMDEGNYTPDGEVIGLGHSIRHALLKFKKGMPAHVCGGKGRMDNGCGALMRMDSIVLYLYAHHRNDLEREDMALIHRMADMTNANAVSRICCGIYALLCVELIHGTPIPQAIKLAISTSAAYYKMQPECEYGHARDAVFARLKDVGAFLALPESEIQSSGYVLDVLETAIWCLQHSQSYEEAVIQAVGFGNNTNVVGAVTGSLAAARYGRGCIPERWLENLRGKERLQSISRKFDERF